MRNVFLGLLALMAFSAQMAAQERHDAPQLIGLPIFSSHGSKLGVVRQAFKVGRDATDDATTIVFYYGGFLGIAGRLIAIPGGKWIRNGMVVELRMSADDVAKLPTYEPKPTCECVGKK